MQRSSILGRAILAVALLIGFYLLAFAVAAGLLLVPYLMYLAGRVYPYIAIMSVVGAGIILWSIVPRPDRFEAPGPRLLPKDHPELFGMLEQTAGDTQQAMPVEVYLVPDMNAWVAQRGGLMGFFSRRVMGLGLPLLQVLSVSQLRAVLAHEFGHFYGGDTQLGAWVYKTRTTMGRTIGSLAQAGGRFALLRKPFEWYGMLFLRITQKVSRQQEYTADALAARTVGATHLMEGLKKVHSSGLAFDAYLRTEYGPLMELGYRPPLLAGFRAFARSESVSDAVDKAMRSALLSGKEDVYDTHPPLKDRLAALSKLEGAGDSVPDDPRPAAELLQKDERELERMLINMSFKTARLMKEIEWSDVARVAYIPQWRDRGRMVAVLHAGTKLADLPLDGVTLRDLGKRTLGRVVARLPLEAVKSQGAAMVACAVATRLIEAGFTPDVTPGYPVLFRNGSTEIDVFGALHDVAEGKRTADDWIRELEEAGVADLELTSPVS